MTIDLTTESRNAQAPPLKGDGYRGIESRAIMQPEMREGD